MENGVNKELQIFLIWNKGRYMEKQIINDIASKYDILQAFEISWPNKSFPGNITRFYNKNMRGGYSKTKECGTDDFIFLVCYDLQPEYVVDPRHPEGSNKNAIINKSLYRQWTGGGFLVHASDNFNEVEENLLFILGMSIDEFLSKYNHKWDGTYVRHEKNMPGAPCWKNLEELFNFADKIAEISQITYKNKILRITASDTKKTKRFLNLKKPFFCWSKTRYTVKIDGHKVNAEIN